MSYYVIVATAGHDTTSSSTAGAPVGPAEHPEQFAKVKADLSLIPGLVDEAIRWTTPVKTLHALGHRRRRPRAAARSPRATGSCSATPRATATRRCSTSPRASASTATPNRHLAFGYGAHLCLGQHLAKMEMRILWEELLPRLKSVELAGEGQMSLSTFVNGPKSLPIAFEMA